MPFGTSYIEVARLQVQNTILGIHPIFWVGSEDYAPAVW